MKTLIITAVVATLITSATVSAQTIIPGGNVSGTWTAVGSPYLIQGEITVPSGQTLNIQPDVEVIFQGHYKLIVNGWLEAIGTETDSVLFTAQDTVTGWHSIRFINAPDTSHLTYCTIQYAIAEGNSPDDYGGGIYCQNSNPMINHCTIRRNSASDGGGVSVDDDSEPVISYCVFSENFATKSGGGLSCIGDLSQISYCTFSQNQSGYFGGGIFCGWTELTISHCTISGNSAIFGAGIFNYYWSNTRTVDCAIIDNIAIEQGGGIFAADCNPMVENCSIMGNSAHFGGGIAISSNANNTEINNCHISDNQALRGGGFYIYDSDPTINKCTINGNTAYNTSYGQGGGIYLEYSESQIRYCTIYGNTAQVEGAGIYCATSNPIILNTIVAESNQNGGIYFADIQNATISYCDFYNNEGGNFTGYYPGGLGQIDTVNYNGNWCDMYFNIFEDPLFADPINNNFQITWQNFPVYDSTKSPCIDAGDPNSPLDPDGSIADIGAFYYNQSGTIVLGGNVSGTWVTDSSPYLIQGEITVPIGETLSIEPGVKVLFQGHYKLIVNGWLEAIGTETDSISFTAPDTITGWHGIHFMNTPDSSHLSYIVVQYGRAEDVWPPNMDVLGGGIYCENSNPVITHSTICKNTAPIGSGGGIYCYNHSNPRISHCSINMNSAEFGGGLSCYLNSNPHINECIISDNHSYAYGGISIHAESNPVIDYCIIKGNLAELGGGGIGCTGYSNPIITHCTIDSNSSSSYGGGIAVEEYATPNISYCIVSRNSVGGNGGGIDCLMADVVINHCTISNNSSSNGCSAVYCGYASNVNIANTIVESNTGIAAVYIQSQLAAPIIYSDFYNNEGGNFSGTIPPPLGVIDRVNINGDSCDIFKNIYLEPLFIDPAVGNFNLLSNSPCIDAGNPNSAVDPDSTVADIGAFYFDQSTNVIISLTPYNPPIQIPASGGSFSFNIAVANNGISPVTADIWCMVTLPNGNPYGPVLGPVNITMPTGFSTNRDRSQTVPASAPSGNYMYRAYIGVYPDVIWDQDSFPFEKLTTGNGRLMREWINIGEPF